MFRIIGSCRSAGVRRGLAWRLLIVSLLLWTVGGTRAAASLLPDAGPTRDLVLTWSVPTIALTPTAEGLTRVSAAGYATVARPGWAQVPFTSTLIALPPAVSPRLDVHVGATIKRPLPAPLARAPSAVGVRRDGVGRPIGGAFALADAGPGEQDALPPLRRPVRWEEAGVVRGVRLVRLMFFPALPAGDRLHLTQQISVTVSWSAPSALSALGVLDDPLLDEVRAAVVNPGDVLPPQPALGAAGTRPVATGPTALIEVDAPGLVRVTYDDVAGLGFAAAPPQNLSLRRDSERVAYEWLGDADVRFEPGEALRFYAEPRFSRWTATDVYRLTVDEAPGVRMSSRSGDPTGLAAATPWVTPVFEENLLYTPDRFAGSLPVGRDGDRWVWDYLHPGHATATYAFDLEAVDPAAPARLTLWLVGYTTGAHRWEVALNGRDVGEVTWAGQTAVTATLTLPAQTLQAGENALTLTVPGAEGGWLDAFAVRHDRGLLAAGEMVRFGDAPADADGLVVTGTHQVYLPLVTRRVRSGGRAYAVRLAASGPYHAYDVTDLLQPLRLRDPQVEEQTVTVGETLGGARRYLVVAQSAVRTPVRVRAIAPLGMAGGTPDGGDYLIISHPTFSQTLTSLVDLRRSQGLEVAVVNVLGIYDRYGDGRPEPVAIHAFLREAYAAWTPRPAYVLLVGDGSYDPRQYRADSPATFVPPYLADVDPWAGETASDNRYACVDGDDALPDLLLGRLPVETAAEARTLVEKIVAYEATPLPGGWNANVLLVADDADAAGDFPAFSDAHVGEVVGGDYALARRYCAGARAGTSDCPAAERDPLHAEVLADWQRGALLAQFAGHASWQQWAAERFFHLDDLDGLGNGARLPLVVEMTCFTGAFHRPEPTLDEALVTLEGGGAVGAWGPTGLGVGTGHGQLAQGFAKALFVDKAATFGEATLAGKLALIRAGQHLDLVDTFGMLGDPALRPARELVPWARRIFLPLTLR